MVLWRRNSPNGTIVLGGAPHQCCLPGEVPRKPVRSLFEIRHDRVIVQEWETSCAAAALATVLSFSLNDPVSKKLVAQRMLHSTDPIKVKVRGGFSLLDMKHFRREPRIQRRRVQGFEL